MPEIRRYFDEPFFTLLPSPPLGMLDPCYARWLEVNRLVSERAAICKRCGAASLECHYARERYFEAARQYAFCLDDTWGLEEF
ncbi:hypothetical protein [Effusibacillus pohliae]|uniref:hypothetical protein n=1 Tax=Effusibacillus pohliae TaxID=232270 RepID=UPI00036C3F19|nr:hypothetical protein [Effusibacillus pohliae]